MSCQAFDTCNIIQEKINTAINEISETVVVLNESSERSISDLSKFYSEIRKTLDERESLLKMKIKDQLKKEENNLKLKEKSLYDHMSKIKVFYEEYEKSVNLSEISLLETCYQRQEIIFKATGQVEKLEVVLPFNELNKENELNSLFKLLGNHKHINSSKETAPIKNKVLNLNSKNMINQIPSSSCNGNTCFAKKKNLNINSVYQNHSKDLKRSLYLIKFVEYFFFIYIKKGKIQKKIKKMKILHLK